MPGVPGLLLAEIASPELLVGELQYLFRCNGADITFQLEKSGLCRSKRYLLLKNDANQRRKTLRPFPYRRITVLTDDRLKMCIFAGNPVAQRCVIYSSKTLFHYWSK